MDKNKSRTDLLAAGRKKLQQFRQKKDSGSKGSGSSHGKSKKSGKGDTDSNASSVSGKPTGLPEVLEEEALSRVDSRSEDVESSSMSGSVDNMVDPDGDVVAVEIPVSTETGLAGDSMENLESQAGEVDHEKDIASSDIDHQERSAYTPEDEGERAAPLAGSDVEDACVSNHTSATADGAVASSTANDPGGVDVAVEPESFKKEGQQQLLIADKGDQVSDAGAMQEADGVGSNQFGRSIEIGLDQDRSPSSSEHHAASETQQDATLELTGVQETGSTLIQASGGKDEESASSGLVPDGSSESTLAVSELDVVSDVVHAPSHLENLNGLSASVREDSAQAPSLVSETYNQQYKPEDSFIFVERSHERPLSPEIARLSEGYDTLPLGFQYPPGIPKLVEAVKGLTEDEFGLLLKSRGLDSDPPKESGSLTSQHNGLPSTWERLKEELFLTSFVNDIFCMQLTEHSEIQREQDCHLSRLDDEMSVLRASLEEAHQRNVYLTEDLSGCKSDLQVTINEKEELQQKLHAANAEITEVNARGIDLQNNLERCQSDIFSLSTELADCKSLMATLQSETENLNGKLSSVTMERNKLGDEKDFLLHDNEKLSEQLVDCQNLVASLKVECSDLSGNVERCHSDMFTLSKELDDCKNLMAAFQAETGNLNGTLSSVTEERNKLVEIKENLLNDNEKLSKELSDCKNMVASLQVECSDLSGNLAFVTEERSKSEGEKQHLAKACEELSLELSSHKDLVEALRKENANLNGNCAMLLDEKETFDEQKMTLSHENERLSSELHALSEQKLTLVHENERLSSELLILGESLTKYQVEHTCFKVKIKEMTIHCEQLREENSFLASSLEMHKAMVREFDERQAQFSAMVGDVNQDGSVGVQGRCYDIATNAGHSSVIHANHVDEATLFVLGKSKSDGDAGVLPHKSIDHCDDPSAFLVFKGHLEEADQTLQKLEKALEGLRSHSTSLSRSSGKVGSPAVSKLIQAFESKGNHDEQEPDEAATPEDRLSTLDLFASTNELVGSLEALLKQLALDAENSNWLFERELGARSTADLSLRNVKVQVEALEEHIANVEAINIELLVLYEALKHSTYGLKEQNSELQGLCVPLQQQNSSLKAEIWELGEQRSHCEFKVQELQMQLHETQQISSETVAELHKQLENFLKEAANKTLKDEQEWRATVSQIVEEFQRLEDCCGLPHSFAIATGIQNAFDITSPISMAVNAAVETIKDLHIKLKAAQADQEASFNLFNEANEKCIELLAKNDLAAETLQKLHSELRQLVSDATGYVDVTEVIVEDEMSYSVDNDNCMVLVERLKKILANRLQLQSVNDKLNSELMSKTKDIEEMNRRCLDLCSIQKLTEDIEGVVKLEGAWTDLDESPVSHLVSLVSFLVCKYREVDELVSSSKKGFGYGSVESTELQGKIQQLEALNLQHENNVSILKQQLSQAEEALVVARSELQEKVNELVQSEQRVSSIREKLGTAVAKGKALIAQRDTLKQSLAETSGELERFKQDLQVKDARIHEVEETLRNYLEAGERVEALESELSYIRNSATALRESFLLKDSLLQRIEEILEDLELPEDFHSKDIIEKVEWLARSGGGNSLPPTDWDQKSSVGGFYPDASYVVMDDWKGEVQSSTNLVDDLRRKYEDLQNKFYGLAEQNDMLEQSLMERNHLVQRWEEILDRINMPAHMRSVEPEDRIEWLGSALSEAHNEHNALLQKIDHLETRCTTLLSYLEESQLKVSRLNAQLEESQGRKSDLEMELKEANCERELLSEKLEISASDHDKLSAMLDQYVLDIKKLQNEVAGLREELAEKTANVEQIHNIDIRIKRLNDLVSGALCEPDTEDLPSGSTDCLEVLLKKLVEDYAVLSSKKHLLRDTVEELGTEKALEDPVEGKNTDDVSVVKSDTAVVEEPNVDILKKHIDEILGQLRDVTEERDRYMALHQSLVSEVETLNQKRVELQETLDFEEQKSISLREKLNVAVKKGKTVVQQRDSLKQAVEELNAAQEQLKSEIKQRENALTEYENKMKELSIYPEKVGSLESENWSLKNQLAETEQTLQEKEHNLTVILGTLGDIDVGDDLSGSDPHVKLEHIGKLCCDLRASIASLEQDSRKSRRAAELLLVELNEVQDRNDHLQEELAKATEEIAVLSEERNVALAAKVEGLSRLEELSRFHSEEVNKVNSELLVVKSVADQLRQGIFDVNRLLAGSFSKDLEFLHNLEAAMESCLQGLEPNNVVQVPYTLHNSGKEDILGSVNFSLETDALDHLDGDFIDEIGSSLQDSMEEMGVLKGMLKEHLVSVHQQANRLSELMRICHREMISQNESYEAIKKDLKHVESIEEEKEREVVLLQKNLFLLYEACRESLLEFENTKAEAAPKSIDFSDLGPLNFGDRGHLSSHEKAHFSEDQIKFMVERLSWTVKSFTSLKNETLQEEKREMKITIANLQKELQEKDAHREKICMELVSQIKEAQAAARGHLLDLQSSKNLVHDLEKQVAMVEEERNLLDQRVKELQHDQTVSSELQERIKTMTDVIASKDNEVDTLMQALDEEESQMEDLRSKIEELEKVLQQKSLDIENLEASRAKVLKKLANTKGKFDELHQLSTTLLAEVEKLQLQVRDRDAEISFLRQEVGRCTKEVLTASQMSNRTSSDGINEILMWLDSQLSQAAMQDVELDCGTDSEAREFKEILQKRIAFILSKLEDLHVMAQSKDTLLQMERGKVEELTRREEILEKALREKESHLNMLEEVGDSIKPSSSTSEIVEVAPVINKWSVPGPAVASQVRSLRKVNTDQVSISIDDNEGGSNQLEDEDDDKVHGFKALTTSRIVPKFTRPVSDMVDGLWVSCDRALMRQPALRLGIMIYWALLHALLATFVF